MDNLNENQSNVKENFSEVNNQSISKYETIPFLKSLYEHCDEQGYINLRFLPSAKNLFIPLSEIDSIPKILEAGQVHQNIYFSAAVRRNKDGTKAGIVQIPFLWLDKDGGSLTEIMESPLPPSAVIETSSGRYQAFWILKEPLDSSSIPEVENILKRLAIFHGGDLNATDASRILRMVNSTNHKYASKPTVTIESFHPDCEYNLSDFDEFLPEMRQIDRVLASPIPAEFQRHETEIEKHVYPDNPLGLLLGQALGRAIVGTRGNTCFELAKNLYNFGASKSEAIAIIAMYVKKIPQPSDHRYPFREAVRTLRRVWKESAEIKSKHNSDCTCPECQTVDGLFGGGCLGYGDRTQRLRVIDRKGDLSAYLLLHINIVRAKQTEESQHTCNHWKDNGFSGNIPFTEKIPKRGMGQDGGVSMKFEKSYQCLGCVSYLIKSTERVVKKLYPDGFFFSVYEYSGESFYECVKKRFDRAGALSMGLFYFTGKVFLMLSDIDITGSMSFAGWRDPLSDALLNHFAGFDPDKPKLTKKVRPPRLSEKEGGTMKKVSRQESRYHNFTTFAKNLEEIYQAREAMGCIVNRTTGSIRYSEEALEFFWKQVELREKNKKAGRNRFITPLSSLESPFSCVSSVGEYYGRA